MTKVDVIINHFSLRSIYISSITLSNRNGNRGICLSGSDSFSTAINVAPRTSNEDIDVGDSSEVMSSSGSTEAVFSANGTKMKRNKLS